MFVNTNCDSSLRKQNKSIIAEDKACQGLIQEMRDVEKFLSNFGFLSFGRDYTYCRGTVFSLQIISTACELTAGSIISCCESACMADAFSLLRKLRDDLFFYLYVAACDRSIKMGQETQLQSKMERNIEKWLNNELRDLSIGAVMKTIGQISEVKDAINKYHLQNFFSRIQDQLNNYVHSNGVVYYNRNVNAYRGDDLQKQMRFLAQDMRFITVSFLFLLTLCAPMSIMSTDYVDSLECNMLPEENSQYWIAPFVKAFFHNNIELIDKSCLDYLRENTCMEIE